MFTKDSNNQLQDPLDDLILNALIEWRVQNSNKIVNTRVRNLILLSAESSRLYQLDQKDYMLNGNEKVDEFWDALRLCEAFNTPEHSIIKNLPSLNWPTDEGVYRNWFSGCFIDRCGTVQWKMNHPRYYSKYIKAWLRVKLLGSNARQN